MHLTGPLVFCFSSFQMPLDHLGTIVFSNRSNHCFFLSWLQKTKSFTRVVDGSFFPDEPLELLSQKAFKAVPSIIGVNNQECGYILPMVRILYFLLLLPQQQGNRLLPLVIPRVIKVGTCCSLVAESSC